jgi:hypothetical protein
MSRGNNCSLAVRRPSPPLLGGERGSWCEQDSKANEVGMVQRGAVRRAACCAPLHSQHRRCTWIWRRRLSGGRIPRRLDEHEPRRDVRRDVQSGRQLQQAVGCDPARGWRIGYANQWRRPQASNPPGWRRIRNANRSGQPTRRWRIRHAVATGQSPRQQLSGMRRIRRTVGWLGGSPRCGRRRNRRRRRGNRSCDWCELLRAAGELPALLLERVHLLQLQRRLLRAAI